MPSPAADGVWVRQSEWVRSNAIVVPGNDMLVLVDPGINGAEPSDRDFYRDLKRLADVPPRQSSECQATSTRSSKARADAVALA